MNQTDLKYKLSAPFNFDEWKNILAQMFPKIDYFASEVTIDSDAVKSGGQIGTIRLDDGRSLGLFKFEVADSIVIARNRKRLREITAKYIDQDIIHGALVFYFAKSQADYRLTLVSKQTVFNSEGNLTIKETAPKRYTFLLGENEPCTTAARRLHELISKKNNGSVYLADVTDAFSVERLNKDFFNGYKAQYAKFLGILCDTKRNRDYVKKLLGRLVFLQFLQKKGWMGVPATNEGWNGGNKNYLSELVERYSGNDRLLSDVLEPLFFETLNTERTNDIADSKLGDNIRIPYLNGGLFDKDNIDALDIDFPYSYFKELMEFFSQYNFTIDENDPDDSEVGIDPEMLGHIFENLLEDNKDKGAFYTPKEIVQYMSKESIAQYLKAHTNELWNDSIDNLIRKGIVDVSLQEKNSARMMYRLLQKIKICDPAIGSGAFPMGVLNVLYHTRQLLYGFIKTKEEFSPAKIKREIIQNNIFGVDIEQGAVDIARLRFWLALVVDASEPEPLPNLDYKIMQGNSLLEKYKGYDLSKILNSDNLFVRVTAKELDKKLKKYYNENNHAKKAQFRKEIDFTIAQCLNSAGIQETIKLPNSDFFLWHTYFADVFDKGGFDIVIGNPPYISAPTQVASKVLANQRELLAKSSEYKTLYQKWDLYIPFMEKGLRMLSKGGSFAMIVPYPLTNQLYAKKFREWVVRNYNVSEIVDLNGTKVFENATVSNVILFATATEPMGKTRISHINESKEIKVDFVQAETDLVQDEKTLVWNLTQEKRQGNRHPDMHVLGDFCYISIGMVLNADEKSEKGAFTKDELISSTKDEIHCKKYIEGKDLEKYKVKRIRYLEYGTERVPDRLRRPTFPELYNRSKLLINALGDLKVAIDDNDNYYCEQQARMAMPWHLLIGVENKSISSSIKKFSKSSRLEMEELSKTVNLKFLLGIMNSRYTSVLLTNIRSGDYHITPEHIRNIPIPTATSDQQQPIITLVDTILSKKKFGEDTSAEEREIDLLVYKLYSLTYDEALIADPKIPITRKEYER